MVMERPNRYATDTPWAAVCCSVSAALPLAGSVVWPLAQECMELAPKDGFTPPCHLEAAKSVPRTCSVPSFPSLLRVFPGFPLMLAESPLPLSFLFTLAVFLQRISCCPHCIIGALIAGTLSTGPQTPAPRQSGYFCAPGSGPKGGLRDSQGNIKENLTLTCWVLCYTTKRHATSIGRAQQEKMKYSFGVNRKKYGEIIVENRRMSRYNEK